MGINFTISRLYLNMGMIYHSWYWNRTATSETVRLPTKVTGWTTKETLIM